MLLASMALAQESYFSPAVKQLWATSPELKVPESVLFDAVHQVIYVANINGKPAEKDGNGFISILSPDGRLLNSGWITGLDAPKGMGIFKERLFVTDITSIAEIDIASAKLIKKYPLTGSAFLNDITIDGSGVVYISDSGNGKIYRLRNGKIDIFLQGKEFDGCNGLCFSQGFLYVGTRNSILRIDCKTKTVNVFAADTGSIDGLEFAGDDTFIVSDWSGSVYRIKKGSKRELLLSTASEKVNAADIHYIVAKKILLVPTFLDNRVVAYEIKN